jgi:hypothetical protein
VQYILSNGVTFHDKKTKPKLGADFDNRLQELAEKLGLKTVVTWGKPKKE